jgi:hypothetical protein
METFSLGSLDKYKRLCELTTKAVEKSHSSERGELLKQFLEPININRVSNKFKPITIARISMLLPKEIPTSDLYYLLSVCTDAGRRGKNYHESFSKKFYWEVKSKKNDSTITNI